MHQCILLLQSIVTSTGLYRFSPQTLDLVYTSAVQTGHCNDCANFHISGRFPQMTGVEGGHQTAEAKSPADGCAVAATLRPWGMMTAQTQIPAPRRPPNVPSQLREKLSAALSAWTSVPLQPSVCLFLVLNNNVKSKLENFLKKSIHNFYTYL